MKDELNTYRQAVIDNFSSITIGETKLSFQESVHEESSGNLNFIFDDTPNQKWIRLIVVVTRNFRTANTIDHFVDKLRKILDNAKNSQLKQDCAYIVPIATDSIPNENIINSYKGKFDGEQVRFLS